MKERSIGRVTGTFGDPVVTSPEEQGEDRGAWPGWRASSRAAAIVAPSRTRRSEQPVHHKRAVTHKRQVSRLTVLMSLWRPHEMSRSTPPREPCVW